MSDRPTIDLDRQRGDFIDVPSGPLDRPARLYRNMAIFGAFAILCVIGVGMTGSWILAASGMVLSAFFGVGLAGRFPAYWFRRDRT